MIRVPEIIKRLQNLGKDIARTHDESWAHTQQIIDEAVEALEILSIPIASDTNVLSKWIPCSERLPKVVNLDDLDDMDIEEFMKAYCLVTDGKATVMAIYDNGTFLDNNDFEPLLGVIAWMPLPAPFKESED